MDKILCRYLGGSHLYGLNGPKSDQDIRGVFMNTDPSYILGLNRFEEDRNIKNGEDFVFKEVAHFMRLLYNANTEALECLFIPYEKLTVNSKEFLSITDEKYSLLDSDHLFNCLSGYIQSELRLALGLRRGKLGGARYEAVQKYGFSPKNFTQLFRLTYLGIYFYDEDRFIVDTKDFPDWVRTFLLDVKFSPEEFNKNWLEQKALALDDQLKKAYENRGKNYIFNKKIANNLLLSIYKPYL